MSSDSIIEENTKYRVKSKIYKKHDSKYIKLTRKQMRDYRSTGKLPEGVTKVK